MFDPQWPRAAIPRRSSLGRETYHRDVATLVDRRDEIPEAERTPLSCTTPITITCLSDSAKRLDMLARIGLCPLIGSARRHLLDRRSEGDGKHPEDSHLSAVVAGGSGRRCAPARLHLLALT